MPRVSLDGLSPYLCGLGVDKEGVIERVGWERRGVYIDFRSGDIF